MRFALTVTGPAYGTQQASSAWQFAQAVLQEGHELACVFFYREGVLNANQLTAPASDEFDLVRGWQSLHDEHGVALHICVAAALRRGVTDEREAATARSAWPQFAAGFYLERARRASGSGAYLRSDGAVLMKRVAFVLSSAPHGSAAGREGLDALLATSALTDDIGVFFVGDGVFQLLPEQRPGAVLARDYIATFKLLSLYDIDQCWLCADSARERGLDPATPWVVDVECLAPDALRARLHEFDVILRF